jgi:predicted RNA methylase
MYLCGKKNQNGLHCMMEFYRHQLARITEKIIDPELHYNNLRLACHDLKDLFFKAVDYDETEAAKQEHIQTAGGQAISTYTAALCITDIMRTRKFLMGIKEAIEKKLSDVPNKPAILLYAGCGPFATLFTPLTTIFSPSQLQMVLLEINPFSIDYLKKTIQQFQLDEYIIAVEQSDAVQYKIADQYQPDILLSETMKPALQKEPQVNIVHNLLKQCKPGTMLIPESIRVDACLIGNMAAEPMMMEKLQTLLDLNASTAKHIDNEPVITKGIEIEIMKPTSNYTRVALDTTVHVYGEHSIGLQESGITLIEPVMDIEEVKEFPAKLLFKYKMEGEPKFNVQIVDSR